MKTLRTIIRWTLGIEFLTTLKVYQLPFFMRLFSPADREFISPTRLWIDLIFIAASMVFGIAWWTLQTRKPSGRRWAIAASLLNVVYWVPPLFVYPRILSHLGIFPWIHISLGVVGLVAFSGKGAWAIPSEAAPSTAPKMGDGTSETVNKFADFIPALGGVAALSWLQYWVVNKKISSSHFGMPETLLHFFMAFLLTVAWMELATTVTGLALRMSPRAFAIGPLRWRMRDGRWVFKFAPVGFLSLGGISAFAPATTEYSLWRNIVNLAAVPMASLLAGVAAVWVANTSDADAPVQGGGLLAFFGAILLVTSATLLFPYRKRHNYSAGALLCQLWMGGPWADLQQVQFQVLSSLTTAMRPRTYDIEIIKRARGGVMHGTRAFMLETFAYCHFLDSCKIAEAGEALKQIEALYSECSAEIPAEQHTIFVFGTAYVLRDPVAARTWWTRMQAKKPTYFNVDYFRALSALKWVEGNLQGAVGDLEKSEAFAQGLPNAGAYEFDRYCCGLLRKAIDEPIFIDHNRLE
jgi:hypothetical protein